MPLVKVREDETLENALRRFKRKCEKSGILSELKKRQHYEKPSAKRKRKALAARKKTLKRLAQARGLVPVPRREDPFLLRRRAKAALLLLWVRSGGGCFQVRDAPREAG